MLLVAFSVFCVHNLLFEGVVCLGSILWLFRGKKIKCEGVPSILFLFRNEFNKFNNTPQLV